MPNPLTYNSSTTPTGTFKRSNISYGLMPTNYGTGYGSLTWYNCLDTTSNYVIVSDTYTLGYSTQGNAKPVMWSTGNTTNQNLIDLINGLPGNTTNFTDYYAAVNWLQGTNKYFLLNNGYENIVTNGLQLNMDTAWWNSFPTTGTTLTNLTTGGANGTLTNGPTFDSSNGGSLVFDGVDDYVNVGNLSTFDNMTIQMFVKVNSSNGTFNAFAASKGSGSDYDTGFVIQLYGSNTSFNTFNVEGGFLRIHLGTNLMTSSVSFGVWANVCLTVSSTYVQFYLNGVAQGGTNRLNNGSSTIGMNNFVLGTRVYSLPNFSLNGNIASTLLYNKALTADEVLQNYNAQKARFGL